MRILIIEDDIAVLEFFEMEFESEGWSVVGAANGIDGCNLIQNDDFDVVITDLKMPGLDGSKVIDAINEHEAPHPIAAILVVSGYLSSKVEKDLIAKGDNIHCFMKPIDPAHLVEFIKNNLPQAV